MNAAKASRQDEFYTQLPDIEKELSRYAKHFIGKTVLCNCDDPKVSNFFHYFSYNFGKLKLKRLITTCYKNQDADLFSQRTSEKGIYLEYDGDTNDNRVPDPDEIGIHKLKGDGDFRSEECIKLMKEADIVVTNPPFSLFREYVEQLVKYKKKFLAIGNHNAISYQEIFALIRENKVWLGYTHPVAFIVPDHYEMREVRSWRGEDGTNWRSLGNACWFTNLDIKKRHEKILLYTTYDPKVFPQYDNYDAIEISRYKEIPENYNGVMGVPLTFLEKYNPDQFEIVGSDYEVKQGLLPNLVKRRWTGKIDRVT
ncbi:MAG: adenine-specific methyltransferase EcoRI family protein [Candidatus Acidiferrales bacterium]